MIPFASEKEECKSAARMATTASGGLSASWLEDDQFERPRSGREIFPEPGEVSLLWSSCFPARHEARKLAAALPGPVQEPEDCGQERNGRQLARGAG